MKAAPAKAAEPAAKPAADLDSILAKYRSDPDFVKKAGDLAKGLGFNFDPSKVTVD